ncbi:MAG: hypothetical protein KDB14_00350 [Planctomycetales bacterium]|nr:hypothetical protein [Planctomycetales bacterium]
MKVGPGAGASPPAAYCPGTLCNTLFETMPIRLSAVVFLAFATIAAAADHRVEALAAKAPEGLAPAIAAQLADQGHKVVRGTSRTVCEIWLAKQWQMPTLEAKGDVNYAFTPGQLIGAIHFPRKGSDFRDQDIDPGLYTMRYAQQPVDGAHVGTSVTRDFLLLIRADADKSAEVMKYADLSKASIEAAQTAHPALLSLQKPAAAKAGSIRHDEEKDWWIAHLAGQGKASGKSAEVALELVVAGQAAE